MAESEPRFAVYLYPLDSGDGPDALKSAPTMAVLPTALHTDSTPASQLSSLSAWTATRTPRLIALAATAVCIALANVEYQVLHDDAYITFVNARNVLEPTTGLRARLSSQSWTAWTIVRCRLLWIVLSAAQIMSPCDAMRSHGEHVLAPQG
jgi:hypothetical protein